MEIRTKFKHSEIILTLLEILEGLGYKIKVDEEKELVYQNKLRNRFVFSIQKFHDNTEFILIHIINSNGKYLIVDDIIVDNGRSWTPLKTIKSFIIEKNLKRNLEEAQKECDKRNGKE